MTDISTYILIGVVTAPIWFWPLTFLLILLLLIFVNILALIGKLTELLGLLFITLTSPKRKIHSLYKFWLKEQKIYPMKKHLAAKGNNFEIWDFVKTDLDRRTERARTNNEMVHRIFLYEINPFRKIITLLKKPFYGIMNFP